MLWIDKNGKFFAPPLIVGGMEHHSPTPEMLLRAGYRPYAPPPRPERSMMNTSGGMLSSGGIVHK